MSPGMLVRIDPRYRSSHKHFARARIIAVSRNTIEVKPFGHGQTETVPKEFVRIWKSRN